MKRFVVCAVLASAATSLQAAIVYNASIGCQETCVSVSLSWAGESFPVNFAQVENSHDDVIFTLGLGSFAGQSTGSILPAPQTFSGISASDISDIGDGTAYLLLSQIRPGLVGGSDDEPDSDGISFSAGPAPEPAAWSFMAAGLALLVSARWWRRAFRH